MDRKLVSAVLLPMALALTAAAPGWARIAGSGPKKAKTDCYAEWDGVTATDPHKQPSLVKCNDGDPNCDEDGLPDGQCTFHVNVCVLQGDVPGCNPLPITRLDIAKLTQTGAFVSSPLQPPTRLDGQSCGTAAQIVLPLRRNKRGTKERPRTIRFRMSALTSGQGKLKRDNDVLVLRCLPHRPPACPPNPAGGPNEFRFQIQQQGADLDNGWTGASHSSPPVFGTRLRMCLKGCDASSTTPCTQNDDMDATSRANGPFFGAPLPLIANGVAVCVVNRYGTPKVSGGVVDFATGAIKVTVNLLSDVYLSSQAALCPRCSGQNLGDRGKCDSGPNKGLDCVTEGLVTVPSVTPSRFALSSSCSPAGRRPDGTLTISLPLTTQTSTLPGPKPCPGQSADDDCSSQGPCNGPCTGPTTCPQVQNGQCVDARGGISQVCCAGDANKACFPTSAASGIGQVVRNGTATVPVPALPDPTFPKCGTATLAATFCEPGTNSTLINGNAGLPGPGAALFPVTWEVNDKMPSSSDCP